MQSAAQVSPARTRGRPRDVIGGVLTIIAGIALLIGTSNLPAFVGENPGPGFFPRGLAMIWIVLGLLLTLSSVLPRLAPATSNSDADPGAVGRVVAVVAGLAGGAFLIGVIGHVPSTAAMTFYFAYVVERTRLLPALVFAVTLSASIYVVFEVLLDVPLPQGPLGF